MLLVMLATKSCIKDIIMIYTSLNSLLKTQYTDNIYQRCVSLHVTYFLDDLIYQYSKTLDIFTTEPYSYAGYVVISYVIRLKLATR